MPVRQGRQWLQRDRVANAWAAVEMTLNLCDGNNDYSIFLCKYLLQFCFCFLFFLFCFVFFIYCVFL